MLLWQSLTSYNQTTANFFILCHQRESERKRERLNILLNSVKKDKRFCCRPKIPIFIPDQEYQDNSRPLSYFSRNTLASPAKMSDDVGGLSVGMVNLIVICVIVGAAFLVSMGWGFARLWNGQMGWAGPQEPSPDQLSYMRQVRYRTKLGMFAAGQDAIKASRDSRATEEGSSYHYA